MEKQEREIGFGVLWQVLKNSILWLVIAAVGLGVLAGVYTKISSTTTYTAKTEYHIYCGKDAASKIRSDMIAIINAEDTTEKIMNEAGIQYETAEKLSLIHQMVHADAVGDNARLVVSVTGTNVDTVVQIAQAYEKYLPDFVYEKFTSSNTTLSVYDDCETDLSPNGTGAIRNALLAALVGFALAYIVFFVLEMVNGKVRGAATLRENFTDVAVLGKIPTPDGKKLTSKTNELAPTAWLASSSAPIAEAYRGLRVSVAHLQAQDILHVVGVTSAKSGDGSALVAVNLAQSYAQLGKRVLLVEADMRTPSVKNLLGLTSELGLSEVLAGVATLEEALVKDVAGVDVLPVVSTPENPAELLAGSTFASLVDSVAGAYDLVLVLSAAMGEVSDASVVAGSIDGYLTVVRAERTDLGALQMTVNEMARLNMKNIGFVITDDISKL